jgi:hypothetical protein
MRDYFDVVSETSKIDVPSEISADFGFKQLWMCVVKYNEEFAHDGKVIIHKDSYGTQMDCVLDTSKHHVSIVGYSPTNPGMDDPFDLDEAKRLAENQYLTLVDYVELDLKRFKRED